MQTPKKEPRKHGPRMAQRKERHTRESRLELTIISKKGNMTYDDIVRKFEFDPELIHLEKTSIESFPKRKFNAGAEEVS